MNRSLPCQRREKRMERNERCSDEVMVVEMSKHHIRFFSDNEVSEYITDSDALIKEGTS